MNFKKAGIFRRSSEGSEQPEVQNDSGGMLAVWGSPGSGKTVTAVKIWMSTVMMAMKTRRKKITPV